MWLVYLAGLVGLAASTAGLQDFLTPLDYDVTFTFNDTDIFNAEAYIQFQASDKIGSNVKNVVLNGHGFNISEIIFLYPSTKKIHIPPSTVQVDVQNETLSFPLTEEMTKNGVYKLRVLYSGSIGTEQGMVSTNLGNERYLTTVLYPAFSRRLYPCFDAPNMRATYTLTLKVNYANNQPLIVTGLPKVDDRQTNKNAKQLVIKYSSGTMKLPPYGVAFTIGAYKSAAANIAIPASMNTNAVSENLLFASEASAVKLMASAAGINSIMIALVPDLPVKSVSGHGFAGLRQALGIDASTLTTTGQIQSQLNILVALVKSIYGTAVSPASWSDIWIAESVPIYIAHRILPKIARYSAWNGVEMSDVQQVAMETTWSDTSMPVTPSSFSSVDQLMQFLSDPAIQKGAAILNMIESIPTNYQPPNAFVNFIKDRKGNAVSTEELMSRYEDYTQLNGTIPKKLKDLMSPWLTQTGYPAIEISRKSNALFASETIFRSKTAPKSYWIVPLYYNNVGNNTNDGVLLTWFNSQPNTEVQLAKDVKEDKTVAVNVKGPGLFRVHYQEHELDVLSQRLYTSIVSIPASVRSTLLSDAIAFAKTGTVKYSQLFTLMKYLVNEHALGPWQVASRALDDLWPILYFSDLKLTFENYATNLVRPLYIDDMIGGLGLEDSSLVNGQLRSIILNHLCDYEDETCNEDLKAAFDQYIPNKEKEIVATDIIPIVYCAGVKHLQDPAVLRQYFTLKYSPTAPSDIKRSLFSFMACPQNTSVLQEFLERALLKTETTGEELPAEDAVMAFTQVVRRPEQMNFLMQFVQKNFVQINSNLRPEHIAKMITAFGELGSTDAHLKMMDFNFGNSSEIAAALKTAKDTIQLRGKLLKDNHDDMSAGMQGLPTPAPPQPTPKPTEPTTTTPSNSTTKPTDKPSGAGTLSATLILLFLPITLFVAS